MLNNFLMNPNWSSGRHNGNKDRVQYIRPSALGQWVDKKTPKDVFNPPSAPYNPTLKKQKYIPTDIYKKDSSVQDNPTPIYPDPVPNPIVPEPQSTSGDESGLPPPDMMVGTDDEEFYDIMSTIDSARNSVNESSSSGINYRNLLIHNTSQGLIEPSGAGAVVVGPSRSNVESQMPTNEGLNGINIPGAWYTSNPDADITSTAYADQAAIENRIIDTDTRAVNRRYVPQPSNNNITAQEMTQNPLRPNVPVARFSDNTSVIVRDSQGNVVLNDNPDNISTADVLQARNSVIGNLTVEVDAPPRQHEPAQSNGQEVIKTEDLPERLRVTTNTTSSIFSTFTNFFKSITNNDEREALVNQQMNIDSPPEMSSSGVRSQEVLQAAESTARVIETARTTMASIGQNTFRAPSGLTSSEESPPSSATSLGSIASLTIATETTENVADSIEILANVVEEEGDATRARPLRAAAAEARRNIQENYRLMESWENPPAETSPPPGYPELPEYEQNHNFPLYNENYPDPTAHQITDIQVAENLLRRSERIRAQRRPPVTQPVRQRGDEPTPRYNLRSRRR